LVEISFPACGKRALHEFSKRLHTIAGHHPQRALSAFLKSLPDTYKVMNSQGRLLNTNYLINKDWKR